MTEKVLGFKEKDSNKFEERLNFPAEITIDENKLVPVVSVEEHKEAIMYWHDKWIKMVEANEKLREKLKQEGV